MILVPVLAENLGRFESEFVSCEMLGVDLGWNLFPVKCWVCIWIWSLVTGNCWVMEPPHPAVSEGLKGVGGILVPVRSHRDSKMP